MAEELVIVDRPLPHVLRVTMNRPEKRNALFHPLRGAIMDALREGDLDDDVKVMIVRGNGPSFCAGYELGGGNGSGNGSVTGRLRTSAAEPVVLTDRGAIPEGVEEEELAPALRVYDLVYTYRTYGHLIADLDPLGRGPREHPFLALSEFGFAESDLDQEVTCGTYRDVSRSASLVWMNPAALFSPCIVSCCSFSVPMTDTNTLQCWRSPDTSARVTVTPFTRGSLRSNRMALAAVSRTTSATRASR